MSDLVFSCSLYREDAVKAAITAFEALATFAIQADDDHVKVSVTDIDVDYQDVLVDEFCNYVLHETVVRSRQ